MPRVLSILSRFWSCAPQSSMSLRLSENAIRVSWETDGAPAAKTFLVSPAQSCECNLNVQSCGNPARLRRNPGTEPIPSGTDCRERPHHPQLVCSITDCRSVSLPTRQHPKPGTPAGRSRPWPALLFTLPAIAPEGARYVRSSLRRRTMRLVLVPLAPLATPQQFAVFVKS